MMRYYLPRFAILLILLLALRATPGYAQTFRGGINGAVTDQDGAAIPNAAVTATSDDTGIPYSGLCSGAGEFHFQDLPVGTYTLEVSHNGFATAKIEHVTVSAGSFFTVPVRLPLASASENIIVRAADVSLDTTSVTQATDIPTTVVNQTPNNGRDFTQLIQFIPGFAGYSINGGDVSSSVNGGRPNQINWQIEGADNNDLWWNVPAVNQGGVALIPGTLLPLDAVEQFSLVTSGPPETGRSSGGTVNISFKSGTNTFHGSAYYFNHNEFFAVETPFAPPKTPKNKTRDINEGFSLGGPIWRKKSFFFVAFEHQHFVIGNQATSTEPSMAYQTAAGSLLAYYGMPINPVSIALLQNLWPQSALIGAATVNNYFNRGTENGHSYNGLIKVDHSFNTSNHLSARWFAGQGNQTAPTFSELSPYYEVAPMHVQSYSIVYNRTISQNIANQIYAGVSYFNQVFADADHYYNPVALGLNTGVTSPDLFGAPQITIGPSSLSASLGSNSSGFDPIGVTSPSGRNDITGHIDEALSYNVGKHQFRFGSEYRKTQVDDFYQTGARGTFRFDGSQGPWYYPTGGNAACISLASKNVGTGVPGYGPGDSYDANILFLADFLAGCVSTSSIVLGDQRRQVFVNTFDLFGQDAYQLTSKLNLNYGLRYDFVDAIHNQYRNLTSFDPDVATGFAIQGQNADNLYVPYRGAISPRIGAAYALSSKLVLRVALGVYFDTPSLQPLLDLSGTTNGGALGIGNNPAGSDPVASAAVNNYVIVNGRPIFPSLSSAISGMGITNVYSVNHGFRPSYTYNYNLNLQQRLGKDVIAQIGYAGTQSRHLTGIQDINQAALNSANFTAATYPSIYPSCDTAKYSYQQCTRPYFAAYPGFGAINQLNSDLNSNYNSLQAVLRITAWHGLVMQTTYTWSRALDYETSLLLYLPQNSFNIRAEYGNSDFDTRNSASAYFVYEIPSTNNGSRLLTHGWEISGIVNLHDGQPFTVIADTNASGNGEFADRADLVPGVNPFAGVSHKVANGSVVWFNSAAFMDPPQGTYGKQRRNQFYNPGFEDTDLSVLKTIDVSAKFKMQFRAEMFNVFNRINLAPVGFPQVDSRGAIGSTIGTFFGAPGIGPGEPFNLQFALKAIF